MKKKKIIAFVAAISAIGLVGCSEGESSSSSGSDSVYVSTDNSSSEDSSSPSSSIDWSSSETESEPEPEPEPEVSVSISGENTMLTGRTQTVTAEVANATDASVTYSTASGNSNVISVDQQGNVTAVAAGTDSVVATSVEDSTKSALLEITVSNPVFDASNVGITTDYTANVVIAGMESTNVSLVVNSQGVTMIMDSAVVGGYWFNDGKVYEINADQSGYFIEANKPAENMTPDAVLASFNISTYIQGSTWSFYAYENGLDLYSTGSDSLLVQFIASMFDAVTSIILTDDSPIELELLDSGSHLADITFANIGSTTQSISPEIREVGISISGESAMLTGRSQTISASVTNADDASVTYSTASGNSNVISVDQAGNVTAVAAGTDSVVATSVEDPTKTAVLSITVTDPVFDMSTTADITTNYTANISAYDMEISMVVNNQGWVLTVAGSSIGYWFDNGNVYVLEMDEDGYYIDMNSPENDATPEEYLSLFNMYTYVQASTWSFYSYKDGIDSFSADSNQAITQFIGSLFTCDSVVITVDADGNVSLELMYSGTVTATLAFADVGTTEQSIDPEYRYFNEGGEAGDDAGAGEDW